MGKTTAILKNHHTKAVMKYSKYFNLEHVLVNEK